MHSNKEEAVESGVSKVEQMKVGEKSGKSHVFFKEDKKKRLKKSIK